MVFVSRLELREFRGVRIVKEPLELSDFTVLVGRNNSGKTTVLDALYLLPHPRAKHSIEISALAQRKGGRSVGDGLSDTSTAQASSTSSMGIRVRL